MRREKAVDKRISEEFGKSEDLVEMEGLRKVWR